MVTRNMLCSMFVTSSRFWAISFGYAFPNGLPKFDEKEMGMKLEALFDMYVCLTH